MPLKSLDAFEPGQAFPPESEIERLERYEKNKLLFEGEHDKIFDEASHLIRPELQVAQRFVLNFHRRLSTHWADMVFGEPPTFSAGDELAPEQAVLEDLVNRNNLINVGYEVALDRSILGDGLLKVRLEDGKAVIEGQPPDYWYPIVDPGNIRRINHHVLAWTFTEGRTEYVRMEIHSRGRIEHRVHLLKGGRLAENVTGQFMLEADRVETFPVDDFLIVPVPGLRTTKDVYGRDDYTDLDTIIQEMEDRLSQMSRILDKHADPGMYGPESALDFDEGTGQWTFKKENYLILESKEDPVPGYLTWGGNLDAQLAQFNLLFDQLLFVAETSPAAFSLLKQGMAESGSALKRLMMADVAKASRITRAFDAALQKVLIVASQLEGRPLQNVSITWYDGLPDDPSETSQIASAGVSGGFMSKYVAIQMMHPTWRDRQIMEELDRIAEDEASRAASSPGYGMPSSLWGSLSGSESADAGATGGNPGEPNEETVAD